jgi:DNA-binding NarL/FixJ family response regulator
MQPHRYPVIILDDHPLVAKGLAQYFQSVRADVDVVAVSNWEELRRQMARSGCPAVLVTDVWLASGNVLDGWEQFRRLCPDAAWLAISGDDDPGVAQRMRKAGAQGFVHKSAPPDTFADALASLLAGGHWFEATTAHTERNLQEWVVTPQELGLTLRQGEILDLVLRGLPNKRIAQMLNLAESTVKEHVTAILERLGVRNRVEAITTLRGQRIQLPQHL